jgi:precorrin-4/cobalt-precorrin-4 C11-methyltransferase
MNVVHFIGAGPGDPELITYKGLKHLKEADVVLYADSLVNPELLSWAKEGAVLVGTSGMTLEEIIERVMEEVRQGKKVVRLVSGDPSIYSAIGEQMARLEKEGVTCKIVPGVSSFSAAAASLHAELTHPDISQTVVLARVGGRTLLPAGKRLRELVRYPSTVVIFLSSTLLEEVTQELVEAGFPPDTPSAAVYRASWKEELVVRAPLEDLHRKVKGAGILRQALIIVGQVLDREAIMDFRSMLYRKDFRHGFRRGEG